MTHDIRRAFNLTLSEADTDWMFVAQCEATAAVNPVHENMLRAEGMLTMAEFLTEQALKLRKAHLNS